MLRKLYQYTLANSIEVSGTGVHSGKIVKMILRPAPENTGRVFRRIDLQNAPAIPARVEYVYQTALATQLKREEACVSTTEHILSACVGMGVDNVYIDVDSEEIPILDGSAAPFVFLIQAAGLYKQSAYKKWLKINKPVQVSSADSTAQILPYLGCKIEFEMCFQHPVLQESVQKATFDFSRDSYWHSLSRARTFGFLSQYEAARAQNLARGASLSNTVVVGEDKVLNKEGLRENAEFVKHKVLDAVGDLALFGQAVLGRFIAYKSGHTLNTQLVQAVLSDPSAWELVENIKL